MKRPTITWRMRVFSAAILLLASTVSTAQAVAQTSRHHSNWVFGVGCEINWDNANVPTVTTNPVISTLEGVATWSDPVTGELLLFTDGITAWNGNDVQISTTALGGHPSAAQSGIIVPVPGSPDEYFVVAQPVTRGSISWTRFDLTTAPGAQVGAPAVIPGTSQSGETLGVITHSNGSDYWIVSLENTTTTNRILVMPVTSAGVGAPVATDVVGANVNGAWGQISPSSDGSQLVVPGHIGTDTVLMTLDFDRCTGAVSVDQTFIIPAPSMNVSGGARSIIGTAWSPDDSKLYTQVYRPGPAIFQVDLATGTTTELGFAINRLGGQLSLGVDGRIYAGSYDGTLPTTHLGVISQPNMLGAAAGFSTSGLAMPAGCNARYGLPTSFNAFSLPTGASLGLDVALTGFTSGTTFTPSGTTSALDGESVTATVRDPANVTVGSCMATVSNGAWTCATNAITGLSGNVNYTAEATISSMCTNATATTTFQAAICGDGVLGGSELCDDGNTDDNDGCSATCEIECGSVCLTPGAACTAGGFAVHCTAGTPANRNSCSLIHVAYDGSGVDVVATITQNGAARHLDALAVDSSGQLFGFVSDSADSSAASHLARIDPNTGVATRIGPDLGEFVNGAAFNSADELWVLTTEIDERPGPYVLSMARINPTTGEFLQFPSGVTGLNGVEAVSPHVQDLTFRSDDSMIVSIASSGSAHYLTVDYPLGVVTDIQSVPHSLANIAPGGVSALPSGLLLVADANFDDEFWTVDLASTAPDLDSTIFAPDPVPANSGSTDIGACAALPVCGDGVVTASEQCDDGGTADGDGCSAGCTIEDGYVCTGEPSTCAVTCGDGVLAATEQCDDGNTTAGDGCSDTCQTEAGWACTNPGTRVLYTRQGIDDCVEVPGFEPAVPPATLDAMLAVPGVGVWDSYRARHVSGAVAYSPNASTWRSPTVLQWDPGTGPAAMVFGGLAPTGQASPPLAESIAQSISHDFAVGVADSVRAGMPDLAGACADNSNSPITYRIDSMSVCTPDCVDDSVDGIDTGCDAATPICDDSGAPTCVECLDATQCDDSNECTTDSCNAGSCENLAAAAGTMCTGGVCDGATMTAPMCVACADTAAGNMQDAGCEAAMPICDTSGAAPTCVECLDATHCDDSNECTTDTCNTNSCENTSVAAGTMCSGGVCDGAMTTSPMCVACVDSATDGGQDAGCEAAAPICDTSGTTPSCEVCVRDDATSPDDGCADPTAICDDSAMPRTCVACVDDDDCPDGSICGPSMTCTEGCTDDSDCAATPETPVCDTEAEACVECVLDTDCDGDEVCSPERTCQQCNSNTDCEGALVCDPVTDTCQECVGDADCPEGLVCNNSVCEPECKTDADCTDEDLPVCDAGVCVECTRDGQCPESTTCVDKTCQTECTDDDDCTDATAPICDTTDGVCVECAQDSDCESGRCHPVNNTCLTGCEEDADCPATSPTCSTDGICVSCVDDSECTGGATCDENVGECVECVEDGDCLEGEVCTGNVCVGCNGDDECESPAVCDPDLQSCESGCTSDADCDNPRLPLCEPGSETCVECTADTDCGTGEICMGNFRCEPRCETDNDCESGTVCDTTDGQCVACTGDDDCEDGFVCDADRMCVERSGLIVSGGPQSCSSTGGNGAPWNLLAALLGTVLVRVRRRRR